MASAKLFLLLAIVASLSMTESASIFDTLIIRIITEFYNVSIYKEGYRFNIDEPNGSKREEVGMIMNPDTEQQELVVMGSYTVYDEKTDIETMTMYTADKGGYRARYMLKNRKLSPAALKSVSGK